MGAKPTIQLAPFIITKTIRNESNWSKGPVWFYIYTHLKEWNRLGEYFDLPIILEDEIVPMAFQGLKVEDPWYYAVVQRVTPINKKTVCLHIRVDRRLLEKKVDYRYGGMINYLDKS